MAMNKGLKLLLWGLAVLVVLILVGYAAITVLLPEEKIVEMIIPKLEDALNREVTVGDVSVSIWGGLGLRLSDLRVINPERFAADNLAHLSSLDVKVKFWPLFKKRVEISRLLLDGLTINLEKTPSGESSLPDFGNGDEAAVERVEPEQAAAALPFSFDDLRVDNSTIFYADDSSGFVASLEGIKLQTRLVPEDRNTLLRSEGELHVDKVTYTGQNADYTIPSMDFSMKHALLLDTEADTLNISDLEFALGKLEGNLTGSAYELTAETSLNLQFRSDDLSMRDVLESIPPELFPQIANLKGSGEIRAVADYKGPARLTRTADVEGKLTMDNIELVHEDYSGKLKMKLAELNFSQTDLTFFTNDAELVGEPFTLKIIVDNIPDPNISAEIDMNLDLKVAEQFMEEGDEVSGRLIVDASAYGKLNEPQTVSMLGKMELEDVKYHSSSMTVPIDDLSAVVEFLGKDLKIENFAAKAGESDIRISGRVTGFAPYMLASEKPEKKPQFTGTLASRYINIDELMGEEEDITEKGTEPADTAVLILPDIDAKGKFDFDSGVYSLVAFEDATGEFDLTDYVLQVENVSARVYDGDVTGSAVVDIENIYDPEFQIDFKSEDIKVNRFLSRFTSFEDRLYGDIDLYGSFSGRGSEPEQIRESLSANGSYRLDEGKLVNFELIKKLAEPAGFKTFDEEQIRDFVGTYRVDSSRVYMDDLTFTTSHGDWRVAGSVGINGSLDYDIAIELSDKARNDLGALGELGSFLQGGSKSLTLNFHLGGTYGSPSVSLNTAPIEESVDKRLEDEGKKLIDKLFNK